MNNDQITNLLTIVLAIMLVILFVLIIVYIVLRAKTKNPKKSKNNETIANTNKMGNKSKTTVSPVAYNKQSIFSFMEFDKIEDNMIVRKIVLNF